MLFPHRGEWSPVICSKMEMTAKWNKPDTDSQCPVFSTISSSWKSSTWIQKSETQRLESVGGVKGGWSDQCTPHACVDLPHWPADVYMCVHQTEQIKNPPLGRFQANSSTGAEKSQPNWLGKNPGWRQESVLYSTKLFFDISSLYLFPLNSSPKLCDEEYLGYEFHFCTGNGLYFKGKEVYFFFQMEILLNFW